MYVEIVVRSEDAASGGKRTQFNTGAWAPEMSLVTEKLNYMTQEPWFVRLAGTDFRTIGDGSRGGTPRNQDLSFEALLTPTDVVAIVRFALEHDLVSLTPARRDAHR